MRGSACKATELNYPVKGDREKNILMSLAFLKEGTKVKSNFHKTFLVNGCVYFKAVFNLDQEKSKRLRLLFLKTLVVSREL